MNKKNIIIIVSILAFIVVVGGISYSYFVYNKDIGNVSLNVGEISLSLSNVSSDETLTGVIPQTDYQGMTSTNYFDFTVNSTVDTEKIYYEIYLSPKSGNTLDTSYLKTYLTDQNDVMIKGITLYDNLPEGEVEDGKVIYKGLAELNNNHTTQSETKDFRLRLWLDETYSEQTSKTFEFDIYVYAKNVPEDFIIPYGDILVRNAILAKQNAETNSCNPTWTDTEDGVVYFSGTNDCVDMNYVWYSGKLWRITAIYPDGAMKLVTQNNITSIAFNESGQVNFYTDASTTSYMYQWLNEDFYDTLYNASQLIDTSKQWNATMPAGTVISTKPLETNMVTANVGLLNNYEFYNSYRCINSSTCIGSNYGTGYLYIGYYWWLLNPYNASSVWGVGSSGNGIGSNPSYASGGRPSIVIKSGLEFTGDGTSSSPYKIVGDKESGTSNELVNTRLSGEYVKLKNGNNEQVFRIIGVEDNKTKIIAMDYAENKNTRKFATSTGSANTLWGSGTTTDTDTWYTYLNASTTGYFDTLRSSYGELFDSGLYYLGTSGYNYKLSVCANTTSGKISVCDETSTKGTFNIGLPRYGEMFATQQAGGTSNSINMWLMNRYSASSVWFVYNNGNGFNNAPTDACGGRPTVHLKSTVKIISGTGTETDPYVVGL